MVGQGSINYANSFGKHNVEAMVLAEIRDYKENSFSGYNKNMSFAELPELSFGQPADSLFPATVMPIVALVTFSV